jgi:hypothetical protein
MHNSGAESNKKRLEEVTRTAETPENENKKADEH